MIDGVSAPPIVINGRFRLADPGGWRTYCERVVERLPDAEVCTPRPSAGRRSSGKAWEQTILAAAARNRVLWSPATSGPVRHPNHAVTIHDLCSLHNDGSTTNNFRRAAQFMIPRLARSASAIITHAESTKRELADRFDVDPRRVHVIAPGVDDRLRNVADVDKANARDRLGIRNEFTAGSVISSIPRKNSDQALEVLQTLAAVDGVQTVVAGWDGPAHVFGAAKRPTRERVRDLGPLSPDDFSLFLRSIDVLVWLPSQEGFGLPVVEAAAAGTISVCTPVPAAREHLAGATIEVKPGPEALLDALAAVRHLLASSTERNQRSELGRSRVQDLTWGRTASSIRQVLNDLRSTQCSPEAAANPVQEEGGQPCQ